MGLSADQCQAVDYSYKRKQLGNYTVPPFRTLRNEFYLTVIMEVLVS